MLKTDLNCDLGEGLATDKEVIPFMSSANIACGYHAGSPELMRETVRLCRASGVAVGAHPGFADRENFGRTEMRLPAEEIRRLCYDQILALKTICEEEGVPLQHVKPHGALYNMACKDMEMAQAICEAMLAVDAGLIMLAPGSSCLYDAARKNGIPTAKEVFADRAYNPDGSLVSRKLPGAVIQDEELAISRTLGMIRDGAVTCIDGSTLSLRADSVCIHGDNPKALLFAEKMRQALAQADIQVCRMSETETESCEDIVLRHSARGMDVLRKYLPEDYIGRAAEHILSLERGRVLLLTGFYVGGFAETDGPAGTFALAKALQLNGFEPVVVCDEVCRGYFEQEDLAVEYAQPDTPWDAFEEIMEKYTPAAVISVEHCGRSSGGQYLNVRKLDIAEHTAPLDILFDLAAGKNIYTLGIGDGGNEIGMGLLAEQIRTELGLEPCSVCADDLIVATTSNWGAYGLAAALGGLPGYAQIRRFTEKTVALGSVDGVTHRCEATVDGFSEAQDRRIVEALYARMK